MIVLVTPPSTLAAAIAASASLVLEGPIGDAREAWPAAEPYVLVVGDTVRAREWINRARLNGDAPGVVVAAVLGACRGVAFHCCDDLRLARFPRILAAVRNARAMGPVPRRDLHRLVALVDAVAWHQLPTRVKEVRDALRSGNPSKPPNLHALGSVVEYARRAINISAQDSAGSPVLTQFLKTLLSDRVLDAIKEVVLASRKQHVPAEKRFVQIFQVARELKVRADAVDAVPVGT